MRCKICGKFYFFSHRCEKLRQQYISQVERYNTRPSDSDMLDPTGLIIAASVISNVLDDDSEANRILNNPPQEQEQKIEEPEVTNSCDKDSCSFDPEPVKTEPSFDSSPSFTTEPSFDSSPDFGSSDSGSFDSSSGGGCD